MYRKAFPELRDTMSLKLSIILHGDAHEETHARTQQRIAFLRNIRTLAEGGEIAVVWRGMDCDGSRYENVVHMLPADVSEVDGHIQNIYEWADGPCGWFLMRPSEARKLRETHRDLALEAFEDGHSHVLYS